MKKLLVIALSVVLTLVLLSACGNDSPKTTEATQKGASATIEVDGHQITIEDADGKSVQDLLTQAGITLGEKDVVSVDPNQTTADNMFILVLREVTVTVVVTGEEGQEDTSYTVTCVGGTVADAIDRAGLELTEDQQVNYTLGHVLTRGMENIVISPKQEIPEVTEPEETQEETEPEETDPTTKPTKPATKPTTAPTTKPTKPATKPTTAPTTKPTTAPTTKPTTKPTTAPTTKPTEPAKTVVNVEYYYDCDGSGHGVKVITYSDGTQEEVEF